MSSPILGIMAEFKLRIIQDQIFKFLITKLNIVIDMQMKFFKRSINQPLLT